MIAVNVFILFLCDFPRISQISALCDIFTVHYWMEFFFVPLYFFVFKLWKLWIGLNDISSELNEPVI